MRGHGSRVLVNSIVSVRICGGMVVEFISEAAAKVQEHLYPVEIVEEDSLRYKVHYVGYSRSFDEWKSKEEIIFNTIGYGDGIIPN